jgi:hypothetical protein
MSTGTETETLKHIDDAKSFFLPPFTIDYDNWWLNQDKELYTFIFAKTGVAIFINAGNALIGQDTIADASGRSLGVILQGLAEMGLVSMNRVFLGRNTGKSYARSGSIFIYSISVGLLAHAFDVVTSVRLLHLPRDVVIVRQLDNIVINPLFRNLPFIPVAPVVENPPLFSPQGIINATNVLTLLGGSIGLWVGVIATNINETA